MAVLAQMVAADVLRALGLPIVGVVSLQLNFKHGELVVAEVAMCPPAKFFSDLQTILKTYDITAVARKDGA